MEFKQLKNLEKFVAEVETALLDEGNRQPVAYPEVSVWKWDPGQLDISNRKLLDELAGNANVYGIFTASKNSDSFSLRYVGKTTRQLARQRIRNHLIDKHEKTGSKLKQIKDHVQLGGSVKISWIKIEPESLRNYVEEELIKRNSQADWNRENK